MMAVILLFGLVPYTDGPVVRQSCLVLEWNSKYSDDCKLCFDQLIPWSVYGDGVHPDGWKLIMSRQMQPVGGRAIYLDRRILRDVRARLLRRSHTLHDPELDDRCANRRC